jgi:hypothetical protein
MRIACPTFPSVTVLKASMVESLISTLAVSSRNPITTCTIFVIACLSWPCFFESNSTCSFNKLQSFACLHIVTMATRDLDVEAKSEDYGRNQMV